jgi:hypothetical protein
MTNAFGDVISDGPFAHVSRNLTMVGHGERLLPNGTTDVWALDGFAYIGTFNEPCGTGVGHGEDALIDDLEGPGVPVFDVKNRRKPTYIGSLPSLENSRINDIKVDSMNSGDILVHSNESCPGLGGPGGFEIYDVDDPYHPVHLASVRVDDANQVLREVFGVVDVGVHNLFLFTQGDRDLVAMQTHAEFGGLQIFDITDPTDPWLVSAWGAEYLCEGDFCSDDPHAETDEDVILDVIFDWMRTGFGFSQNRYHHDVTVNADGTRAYLSHWDAGLVLMDITDPADPDADAPAIGRVLQGVHQQVAQQRPQALPVLGDLLSFIDCRLGDARVGDAHSSWDDDEYITGDRVTCFIQTVNDKFLRSDHDVTSPHPRSRDHSLAGTQGVWGGSVDLDGTQYGPRVGRIYLESLGHTNHRSPLNLGDKIRQY